MTTIQYSVIQEEGFQIWQVMISVNGSASKMVNLFDTKEAAERNAAIMRNVRDYPTVTELQPFLGDDWAICRKTARNLARYKRCITPKEYATARDLALAARREPTMAEG